MRQSVTYKEKSEGFANQTFRLLLVGRSRSGFSSPDSDTYYTLGLAVETITESSMSSPLLTPQCSTVDTMLKHLLPVYEALHAEPGQPTSVLGVERDCD